MSADDLTSTTLSSSEDLISAASSSSEEIILSTASSYGGDDVLMLMPPPKAMVFGGGDGPTSRYRPYTKPPSRISGLRSLEKRCPKKIKKYSSITGSGSGGTAIPTNNNNQKTSIPKLGSGTNTAAAALPILNKSSSHRSALKPTRFEVPTITHQIRETRGSSSTPPPSTTPSNCSKIPKGASSSTSKYQRKALNTTYPIDLGNEIGDSNNISAKKLNSSDIKVTLPSVALNRATNFMCAQRNYNQRKSLSQMDLQQHLKTLSRNSRELVPVGYSLKPNHSEGMDRSVKITDEFFNYMHHSENDEPQDSRIAGMKIFATIMLNAWRRRRDDVKRLNDEVVRSRKSAIKVKNQIHVLNSLFKIEQKQNDELNLRLRRLLEDQRKIQDLYDDLNLSFVDLQTANTRLEESNNMKERELEGLEMVLDETKSQLFHKMTQERELETCLSDEQRKVQELEDHKNDLMSTITQLRFEHCEKQVKTKEEILAKDEEVAKLNQQLEALERQLLDLKHKESEIRVYKKLERTQRHDIEELRTQVLDLNGRIESYLPNRIFSVWKEKRIPQKTFKYMHLLGFYLLPAIPPPEVITFPKVCVVDKVFGFVWG